jgi:hypothetical protein
MPKAQGHAPHCPARHRQQRKACPANAGMAQPDSRLRYPLRAARQYSRSFHDPRLRSHLPQPDQRVLLGVLKQGSGQATAQWTAQLCGPQLSMDVMSPICQKPQADQPGAWLRCHPCRAQVMTRHPSRYPTAMAFLLPKPLKARDRPKDHFGSARGSSESVSAAHAMEGSR